MKKLLAVTAMAALVAGAAFAAPSFSAKGGVKFDLATFDTAGNYSVLGAPAQDGTAGTIKWDASVKGEKTEAKIAGTGAGTGLTATFIYKPVDMLTLGVTTGKYTIGLDLSPVTVDVTILGPVINNGSFTRGDSVKVTYAGGNIGTMYVKYTDEGVAKIEAGYKNTISGFTVSDDVVVALTKSGDDVATAVENTAKVEGKVSTVSFDVASTQKVTSKLDSVSVTANASLPVSDMTLYCFAEDKNVLADTFKMDAKVGLKGTYEVIGWDVALTAGINGSSVAFTIPVVLSASF